MSKAPSRRTAVAEARGSKRGGVRKNGWSVRVTPAAYDRALEAITLHPMKPSISQILTRGIDLVLEENKRLFGMEKNNG